jgi:uncharacterized protein
MIPSFKVLAGIVVALTGGLVALGLLRSRRQPRFPYMANRLSDADRAALAARPGWRAHDLAVAPGVVLHGLVRDPATRTEPWVLFFGGNSARALLEGQQVLDALCARQGWGGAVWAYRGFDSSGGTPKPSALLDDALTTYRTLLKERSLRPDAVHVIGFSLGTSMAAAVAARAHAQPPASLVLLAPLTRIYLGARLQPLLHGYETTRWLEHITSPVLVIHGVHDAALGIEGARAVAAALGPRATLLELPDTGHQDLPLSAAAQQAMRTFIDRHAARPQARP